jgi:hypothetical protein
MPSVALIYCQRCESTAEHPLTNGPIPVITGCTCGGRLQISRIVQRRSEDVRDRSVAYAAPYVARATRGA